MNHFGDITYNDFRIANRARVESDLAKLGFTRAVVVQHVLNGGYTDLMQRAVYNVASDFVNIDGMAKPLAVNLANLVVGDVLRAWSKTAPN
jgi:hypothetical protein